MRHENPTSCGPIESVYLQCETLSVYIKCLCVKIPWNAVQNRSTEAAARSIFIRFAIGPVCQAQERYTHVKYIDKLFSFSPAIKHIENVRTDFTLA